MGGRAPLPDRSLVDQVVPLAVPMRHIGGALDLGLAAMGDRDGVPLGVAVAHDEWADDAGAAKNEDTHAGTP